MSPLCNRQAYQASRNSNQDSFFFIIGLWLGSIGALPAANDTDPDLVTMRNGDIHNGRVVDKILRFQTSFGTIELPKGADGPDRAGGKRCTRPRDHPVWRYISWSAHQQRADHGPAHWTRCCHNGKPVKYPYPDRTQKKTVPGVTRCRYRGRYTAICSLPESPPGFHAERHRWYSSDQAGDIHIMDIHQPDDDSYRHGPAQVERR